MAKKKDQELKGEGFVIHDRRSSHLSDEEVKEEDQKKTTEETGKKAEPPPEEPSGGSQYQIDFSTFVMSLTSSAFYHLGDVPDPLTGKKETNLPAVQQTIDMLIMLKEKTRGNLSQDESKLLEQLIYELQMKYVEKTRSQGQQS